MTGEVGHFEIPADKPDRARKFYSATFGWKMSELPGMDYTMVSTGPVDDKGTPQEPGFIGGGIGKRGKRGEPLEHPVVTIVVDEITEAEKRIEKNGGTIIQRKKAVGENMGWTAYFRDSEGNIVGLYQWPPQPPQ